MVAMTVPLHGTCPAMGRPPAGRVVMASKVCALATIRRNRIATPVMACFVRSRVDWRVEPMIRRTRPDAPRYTRHGDRRMTKLARAPSAFGALLVAVCAACSGSPDDVATNGNGGAGGSSAGVGGGGGWAGSSGLSCGERAAASGWAQAFCEWNGNDACEGQGPATSDCDHCCNAGGSTGGAGGTGGTSSSGGSGGTSSGGGSGGAPPSTGFGFPVGDKTTSPAGGWVVWQMLGHYWSAYGGRHLAQDISKPGGTGAIDAPVYSVADGIVLYAKPNSSSYANVLLIEHDLGNGQKVCSFFGHINPPLVQAGDPVTLGQQVATIRDWALCSAGGSSSNTHLHYVLASEALCAKAKNWNSICGYDHGGDNGLPRNDLGQEPYYYTAVNDDCGAHTVTDGLISPTQFIDDHHF
jgi:murein DD-endopeptidase MepM/ murein hydrolase activator NlpD